MTKQVSSGPTTTDRGRRPRRLGPVLLTLATASAALIALVTSGAPSAVATPTTVVVPNANATTEGNGNNSSPFDCGNDIAMRYQQVYAGAQVGPGSISQLAFRDATFSSTVIPNVTITLSTTTKAVTGLDTTFANNVGSDVTTVYSGDLTLSAPAYTTAPGPFSSVIDLQRVFAFNPAGGNLLLDVTIPTCENTGANYDADFLGAANAVMARMEHFGSSTSATGGGDGTLFGGLVTQFTFGGTSTGCTAYRGITICPTTTTSGPPPRH
jgi:hypothetical protein